jgi:hypothetical protein
MMIDYRRKVLTATLLIIMVLTSVSYVFAGMKIFLKNGQVVHAPVNQEDFMGLSFDDSLQPGNLATGARLPVTENLAMWLDASDVTGLFQNEDGSISSVSVNDPVALWKDKSGNGHHFKQANRATQPRYAQSGIGGKPSIMFNTSQSMMSAANFRAPVTVFYVARQMGGANGRVLSAVTNNWLLGYWRGAKNQAFYQGWVSPQGTPATDDAPHQFTALIRGQGQNSEIWANGKLVASNQNGMEGPHQLAVNMSIQSGAYSAEPSNCQVAEILVYQEALSVNARQAVEAYLHSKWGIKR